MHNNNKRLRILRNLLEECIRNIDSENSNHSEEELDAIIKDLTILNRGVKRISKRKACEKILHCSQSTFDKYLKLGLIPAGHKEYGFKELSWSAKDFDEAVIYRIKEYKKREQYKKTYVGIDTGNSYNNWRNNDQIKILDGTKEDYEKLLFDEH